MEYSVYILLSTGYYLGIHLHLFASVNFSADIYIYTYIHVQYVVKSIATCKKNPYIINQNHICSKNYCEVISG